MQEQVDKYLSKLIRHGLIDSDDAAGLYGLDDEIYTNRNAVDDSITELFRLLNINSLMVARPETVRWELITDLIEENPSLICPCDCETLTFIHDIPVVETFDVHRVAHALNRRKGCIVADTGIITTGTVSLEQAFVSFSSICFATFVKYFADTLNGLFGYCDTPRPASSRIDSTLEKLSRTEPYAGPNPLSSETPDSEDSIITAMDAAGKAIVAAGLVDSFFGNISFRKDDLIYISQTGSSLDELPGYIDCVPLDGSSTSDLTSSSELVAHVRTYGLTGDTAILHGHPRFSVIMSMFGPALGFEETRFIEDVPVVAGEVGAGRYGLMHTLPSAMEKHRAAIVYGHGTFTSCLGSFHDAFGRLSSIEHMCFEAYREVLSKAGIS
ncbi:MAG TPA: class II aldolase/adducin family protein [Deltaproteobacteria bacterium]|nr:class II aldolase/adducin family protein [Deltaproteobacteria bacterium]